MDAGNFISEMRWISLRPYSDENESSLNIRQCSNVLSKLLFLLVSLSLIGFFLAFKLMILNNAKEFIKAATV